MPRAALPLAVVAALVLAGGIVAIALNGGPDEQELATPPGQEEIEDQRVTGDGDDLTEAPSAQDRADDDGDDPAEAHAPTGDALDEPSDETPQEPEVPGGPDADDAPTGSGPTTSDADHVHPAEEDAPEQVGGEDPADDREPGRGEATGADQEQDEALTLPETGGSGTAGLMLLLGAAGLDRARRASAAAVRD